MESSGFENMEKDVAREANKSLIYWMEWFGLKGWMFSYEDVEDAVLIESDKSLILPKSFSKMSLSNKDADENHKLIFCKYLNLLSHMDNLYRRKNSLTYKKILYKSISRLLPEVERLPSRGEYAINVLLEYVKMFDTDGVSCLLTDDGDLEVYLDDELYLSLDGKEIQKEDFDVINVTAFLIFLDAISDYHVMYYNENDKIKTPVLSYTIYDLIVRSENEAS